MIEASPERPHRSAPYRADNLLDAFTAYSTLDLQYRHAMSREQEVTARRLRIRTGDVLSVGCGWHPGRHLFPAPAFRIVAVDADPERVAGVVASGGADEAEVGYAGRLPFEDASFDVVLYRLVMHHLAYQGPLEPYFVEAARLLRPGGALVAIEPGLWHPVGLGLALANRAGAATAIHGTPDDIPLSPRTLVTLSERVGLRPEIHAITYTWRRMPRFVQRSLQPVDELGSRRRAARFGHTLLLIARADRAPAMVRTR